MQISYHVFTPLGLNAQSLITYKLILKRKKFIEQLKEFYGKQINYDSIFYHQKKQESKYSKTYNVHEWHNTPLVFRKNQSLLNIKNASKAFKELWIRETGVINYQIEMQQTINNEALKKSQTQFTSEIRNAIKKIKQAIETQTRTLTKNLPTQLITWAEKIEETQRKPNQKTKKNIEFIFDKEAPAIFLFIRSETTSEHDFLSEWIQKDLTIIGGSTNPIIIEHGKDFRYHSRGLHILLTNDETLTKKGRKILKTTITNALHTAYSIPLILSGTKRSMQKFPSVHVSSWDALIHYLNPLLLGGKGYSPSFFVKAVVRSWFIKADLLLKVREKFIQFFESIVEEEQSIVHVTPIIFSMLKLPLGQMGKLEDINYPEIDKSHLNNKFSEKILQVLLNHHKIVLEETLKSTPRLDFKYQIGLTASKITEMLGVPNGIQTEKVKKELSRLVKMGLIYSAPYVGPGRRKNSKIYFIAENISNVRNNYLRILRTKLIEPYMQISQISLSSP